MLFDYETIRIIAYIVMAFLIIGYLITDGFDFGAGTLLPFVAKTDSERRVVINTMAPTWEGNQVWLITLGGALFAYLPQVYATTFSGFYFGVLLVLFALFFRPAGFDFRSKRGDKTWRYGWDWALFIGNFVPALVFGVVVGNIFQGVPFYFDETLRSFYEGGLFYSIINDELTWGLLNPIALLFGVSATAIITMHGAIFLQLRTDSAIKRRVRMVAKYFALAYLVLFSVAGVVVYMMDGYTLSNAITTLASNPTYPQDIAMVAGGWLTNFYNYPILWTVPLIVYVATIATMLLSKQDKAMSAFVASSTAIAFSIITVAVALFPFILPSSIKIEHSMTIWNATASALNMNMITYVAIIFTPIILGYTLYAYYKTRGVITIDYIENNSKEVY
jgi:cytochrome d ubiquinol oxidase subunit II